MVLIPSNLNLTPTKSNLTVSTLNQAFKVGQVLTANIQPTKGNQVSVTIGNQTFLASTRQPINESGTVQVKVKQLVPEIQLSIIKPNPNSGQAKLSSTQLTVQTAYRQFIPSQAPLSQTFQQINLMQSLPPAIQIPLKSLINQYTRQENAPDGKSIKDKIMNSGLFLENKLKSASHTDPKSGFKSDMKAQLLQLQQQTQHLQSTTQNAGLSKLSQLLNQAISRLTVQQIQLYENPNMTPLSLLNDRQETIDENQLEIHKKVHNDKTTWEVYIELSLPQGLLSTKLSLSEQNEDFNCYLWCETDALQTEVEQHLEKLKQQFETQGLNLENIQIVKNKPEKSSQSIKVALVDIKV